MRYGIKRAACLCALMLAVCAVPAVSVNAAKSPAQSSASAQADSTKPKSENVRVGKVTAVNGSQITLAVCEKPAKKDASAKREKNSGTSAEKPSSKSKDAAASGTDTETGSRKKHGGKRGHSGSCIETGETITVTVAENVTLEKHGKTISVTDIAEGDILKLVYDDNGTLIAVKTGHRHGENANKKTDNAPNGKVSET